jgi:ribonuclease HII
MRSIILIDGNKKIPNISTEQRAIVSGDKIVKSISAASIIAKVTRDRIMREMDKKYPGYGFEKHKGYGTALHMEKLKKHGACEIHRKSFEPIKSLIRNQ